MCGTDIQSCFRADLARMPAACRSGLMTAIAAGDTAEMLIPTGAHRQTSVLPQFWQVACGPSVISLCRHALLARQ